MMKHILFPLIALMTLIAACNYSGTSETGPEAVLARMRADSAWIHELDSLAQIALGPGAKCIDPVSHSFAYDGHTWLFNQDWGDVLEIPADYIIEDDLWQAEFSFHGTRAWSPDSLILISFYAGFQGATNEESLEATISGLAEDGFTVLEQDENDEALTIRARSDEGINYYGRYLYADENGVEYAVSVQYPDEKSSEALAVIELADRYPVGPNGLVFNGMALF